MSQFADVVNKSIKMAGESVVRLNFSAAGLVTNQYGVDVGTTPTSGIYKMKKPEMVHAISALGDAAAIIYLPAAASCPLQAAGVSATTGAAGGDISVYDEETGAEISTYGDMDADLDLDANLETPPAALGRGRR